ncbi:hypothetical protein B9Z55_012753 [Caenorhabditis nigoni]|uniref:DUF38 domain-containing protein n=1 Tax=Caenorhabditis nigoni TaxID=1611254 RepID=A0A2G5TZ93_9PELO|nr:hypothetical protein B9Z55_012753 [Caenorhabditis nigoni]
MSFDIDKLAEKTGNLLIDPVYDTNWCDMPAEIKLECIGKLELEERTPIQKLEFLFYILKIGIFDKCSITFNDPVLKEFKNYTGKISAKNIGFSECDNEMVVALLQKMNTGVESIEIHLEWSDQIDYNFNDILAISQVQNAKYWFVHFFQQNDCIYKVAQILIDQNSKIGFNFLMSLYCTNGSFEEFLDHFADRIVSENDRRVRIRTNNPDRHILLEHGRNDFNREVEFSRLMVISAEMKESEYNDNYNEWMRKMNYY